MEVESKGRFSSPAFEEEASYILGKRPVRLAFMVELDESNMIYTQTLPLPRTAPITVSSTLSVAIASVNVATLCDRALN